MPEQTDSLFVSFWSANSYCIVSYDDDDDDNDEDDDDDDDDWRWCIEAATPGWEWRWSWYHAGRRHFPVVRLFGQHRVRRRVRQVVRRRRGAKRTTQPISDALGPLCRQSS